MKRLVMFLIVVPGAGLLLFVGGCGRQTHQPPQTHSDAAKNPGATVSRAAGESGIGTSSNSVTSLGKSPEVNASNLGTFTLSTTREPAQEFTVDGPDDQPSITLSGGPLSSKLTDIKTIDQGTIRSPDGTVYVGEMRDAQPSGQGTYTDPQGTHQQGEFRNGRPYRISGIWV